jgi:hypothetical protein
MTRTTGSARYVKSLCLNPAAIQETIDSGIALTCDRAFQVSVEQGLPPLAAPRLAIVRFAKWPKAGPEQQLLFEAPSEEARLSPILVPRIFPRNLRPAGITHGGLETIHASRADDRAPAEKNLHEAFSRGNARAA